METLFIVSKLFKYNKNKPKWINHINCKKGRHKLLDELKGTLYPLLFLEWKRIIMHNLGMEGTLDFTVT